MLSNSNGLRDGMKSPGCFATNHSLLFYRLPQTEMTALQTGTSPSIDMERYGLEKLLNFHVLVPDGVTIVCSNPKCQKPNVAHNERMPGDNSFDCSQMCRFANDIHLENERIPHVSWVPVLNLRDKKPIIMTPCITKDMCALDVEGTYWVNAWLSTRAEHQRELTPCCYDCILQHQTLHRQRICEKYNSTKAAASDYIRQHPAMQQASDFASWLETTLAKTIEHCAGARP